MILLSANLLSLAADDNYAWVSGLRMISLMKT
jgi:hypothetical protein